MAAPFSATTTRHVLATLALLVILASKPHAAVISPRRLVEVADFSGPVVSPDGRRVAYRVQRASIERNVDDSIWYVQNLDGTSLPLGVGDGGIPLRDTAGIPLATPATWSPNGRWIYFRASIEGKIDVWRAATDGSRAEPVTRDPGDVRDFALSDDGTNLKYSVGAAREDVRDAEQAEYARGIRVDANTPIGQSLYRSGNIGGRLETQRLSPTWFNRVPLMADVPDHWKVLDLATGAKRDLAAPDIPAKLLTVSDLTKGMTEPWKLAVDARTGRIALLTRVGNGDDLMQKPDVELAMLPTKNAKQTIKCQAEACTNKQITDIQWRPSSDEVLFTVTDPDEGLAQSIFRWNVKSGQVYLVVHAQGQVSGGGRWDAGLCGVSSAMLACVAADADRPPRLERIDLENGERKVLFDPNAALAHDMTDVRVRLLRWKNAEGRQFTGQFYPATRTGGPPPLFVTYYKCPGFVRGGVGDEWPLASMAERGISALCINAAPYRMNAVERYDIGLSAVRSAVDLLSSNGEVDRARVGMGGLSFGSEETLWVAMNSDLLIAASVSSTLVTPTYYLFGSSKGEPFFSGLRKYWQLDAPDKTPERWRKLSPTYNLAQIRCPVLMQMPEQEYINALDYALPLVRDHRADLYVFPNEPHQKFQPAHKLAVYERNLDWFLFWLLGVESSDVTKAEQYSHWHAMREGRSSGQVASTRDQSGAG